MVDVSQTADKRIFLRQASGLIRTASFLDVFIFNVGLISIGIGIGTMLLYGPAFYPGASLFWALLLGAAATFFMAWAVINLLLDPVAAGHDPVQLAIVGGVILTGLVYYFVMQVIRRSQGFDITLAFKEIPVE